MATKIVTLVARESLTSGDQKWKGAADTLNKYPTDIISKAKFKYLFVSTIASLPLTSDKLDKTNIPSKLVIPEFKYNKQEPNNIKQDDKPPSKKYVSPADVESSESLYNVAKIYNP
jgi:hypothetical protein